MTNQDIEGFLEYVHHEKERKRELEKQLDELREVLLPQLALLVAFVETLRKTTNLRVGDE
jgi:hypothetical protein